MRKAGYRPFPNLAHRNLLQRVIEVPLFVRSLGLRTGARVLEIGCGRGVALPVLRSHLRPTVLVGVDVELDFLREAQRTMHAPSPVHFVQADVRRLPFPSAAFDIVIDFGTCYHVDGTPLALAEIARVLSPGGVLATESKLAQVLAHPFRTRGCRLNVSEGHPLRPCRHAGLWLTLQKGKGEEST